MAEVMEQLSIPNKPKWECKIATEPRDAKTGFTVGETFTLGCEGAPLTLKEPLTVVLPEKAHHVLVLLKPLEITDTKVSYLATSYRPGQFKMPFFDFTDASGGGFISQPMEIKTGSVIDPQKPPQNPYGPIGPLGMAWPQWFFFSIAVFLMVLVAWLFVFLRRRIQRKNIEKNIKKFQSPMGSFHQYSKDIRLLKRGAVFSPHVTWSEPQKNQYLDSLEESYRMFILREYIVPADRWPVNMVIKHMKKKDRLGYAHYAESVKRAFRELERAKSNVETLTPRDIEQITSICTIAVDTMWKNKKAGAR